MYILYSNSQGVANPSNRFDSGKAPQSIAFRPLCGRLNNHYYYSGGYNHTSHTWSCIKHPHSQTTSYRK